MTRYNQSAPADWPNTPDTGRIAQGPTAFGYTEGCDSGHDDADPLFHFIGKYLGSLIGATKIGRTLRENKGKTLMDMVTSALFSYGVSTLENHQAKWTQDEEVSRLDCAVERGKYKNYKKLTSRVDREKYGPKARRYTMGKGQKRIFGETSWSKDGQESFFRVREMYDTILEDDEMWGWMHEGWEKYSEKRDLFCHYTRKEVEDVPGGNSDGEEREG